MINTVKVEDTLKTIREYTCSISSEFGNVHETIENIMSYFHRSCRHISDCSTFEIKVILNELIINAVRHGNGNNNLKCVKITARIDNNSNAILTVEDEGSGFNYRQLLESDCCICNTNELDSIKETGRGIFIVRNLSDSIEFNKEGNRVTIIKKLL